MKGFGIEIKNDLLEPKHVEQMGSAVWLYMFLVDKMTSISEAGEGKVLGGKPIKYEEILDELGISQDTYTRWIDKLTEYPYIRAIRTPYGISYVVLKAHKRFRKKAERFRKTSEVDSAKPRNLIKTVSVDSIKDIHTAQSAEWGESDLGKYLESMLSGNNRNNQIIARFLGYKSVGVNQGVIRIKNKDQAQQIIRRYARAASNLKAYTDTEIDTTMEILADHAKFDWGLETATKYISYDRNKLVDILTKIK